MTDNKVYTIDELITMYNEDTLPKDVKVFKYYSAKGEYWMHIDELKKEAMLAGSYIHSSKNKKKI